MLTPFHPLRVAVLSSRRCPGISELLADPARGRRWNLVAALAGEDDFDAGDLDRLRSAGVPLIRHSVREFHRSRGARLSDFSVRRDNDSEIAAKLAPFRPDLLLFSGYLHVATPPLLELTARRAVNIHGSDLTRRGPDGRPKYPGLRAVADAILGGEPETRATAHWVTEDVDAGPVIARSPAYPVPPLVSALLARGDRKGLKAYAFAHQEWMLHEAWGPLWQSVLRLVAAGRTAPETFRAGSRSSDAGAAGIGAVKPAEARS